MKRSFHNELISRRDLKHSKNHPLFDLWSRGKLAKEQTAMYCIQHYHFVTEFFNWMAYEASQIPCRDVKAYLFENLGDEENPEDRHLDMLTDYVVASGLDPEQIEAGPVLPGTEALQNWGWRMVYQKPWQATLAGMFIGIDLSFWTSAGKSFLLSKNTTVMRQARARFAFLKSTSTPTRFMGKRVLRSSRSTVRRRGLRPLP